MHSQTKHNVGNLALSWYFIGSLQNKFNFFPMWLFSTELWPFFE